MTRLPRNVGRLLRSDATGGVVIRRRLLPAVILLLLLLGFLRFEGERRGFYGTRAGVLLMAATAMSVTGGLLWHFARWLDRSEALQLRLQGELRRSSRHFELSRDPVCTAGYDGVLRQLSKSWTETLGWTAEELRSRPFVDFVHPDDRETTIAGDPRSGTRLHHCRLHQPLCDEARWLDLAGVARDERPR